MKLDKGKIESKVNRIVKDYIRHRIDIVDVLEFYFYNDNERLDKIIKRFNAEMYDEKNGNFDKTIPLTIEDIKEFRYYLNDMIKDEEGRKLQKRSLHIQRRLLNIIAEEAMLSDLEDILTNYNDKLSIQSMIDDEIICSARYVESDLLYTQNFGNPYSPYYIKYTWEEYKEMYFANLEEADEYAYKILAHDKAVYTGDTAINRNTVCALMTLAFSTAIAIMYEKHNMEDEGVEMIDYVHSCINSDIIVNILNYLCISSSVLDILYFMVDTIDEIFNAIYIRKDRDYLIEYLTMYSEGEIVIPRIEYFLDEVFKDLI